MATIRATWNGKMAFRVSDANGHELIVDTDPEHGGELSGFFPKQLVLIGLAGCTGMDVISILRKMRQDARSLEIVVTGDERDESPKYYDRIVVEYIVTGDVEQDALDRAIALSRDKYCAVHAMIKDVAEIEFRGRIVAGTAEPGARSED